MSKRSKPTTTAVIYSCEDCLSSVDVTKANQEELGGPVVLAFCNEQCADNYYFTQQDSSSTEEYDEDEDEDEDYEEEEEGEDDSV
jgi:hypothetical protein